MPLPHSMSDAKSAVRGRLAGCHSHNTNPFLTVSVSLIALQCTGVVSAQLLLQYICEMIGLAESAEGSSMEQSSCCCDINVILRLHLKGLPAMHYDGSTVHGVSDPIDSPYQVRLTLVLPKSLRLAMETASGGSPMPSWMAFTTT